MPNLPISTGASAMRMAEAMFGDGVDIVGASYSGDPRASGLYSNADQQSPLVAPSDSGVILSTGLLRDFTNAQGASNQRTNTSTDLKNGVDNDPAFNALAGTNTYDASYIDVDFIPTTDTLSMQFVFSSEEYPEYSNALFTDMIGVWVDGQPVDLVAGDGSISIENINDFDNADLYVDNTGSLYNTEMDGFTVTLTLKLDVRPGEVNSLRIGIADVSDAEYDSALMIAGESIQGDLIAGDDDVTVGTNYTKSVDVLANDEGPDGSTLYITHINGREVLPGDSVTLKTGQVVTLNADGTLGFTSQASLDETAFTYTVSTLENPALTDTAFVTLSTVPCFVAGTRIATPEGEVPVEALRTGDLVNTRDDGPQPVRWIGRRQMRAEGDMAPVWIRANAFGRHGSIMVSPLHRILVANAHAELFFGEAEVLIAARDLVDGTDVKSCPGGVVDYVHLLFDRHQVLWSNGLLSESFLPGPQTTHCFEAETVAEIATIFPELDPETGTGYSPAARRALKPYEARVLVA